MRSPLPKSGRGAQINPPNRFEAIRVEPDFEHFEEDAEFLTETMRPRTEYFVDTSRSIISENDSPDVPFRFSLNPYRGCQHGCAYCYARPTHEYLGLSAGVDFESKIFVKRDAAALFRDWLARDRYRPELIAFSGVTDCYQPAERKFRLTRSCLEVARDARQPVGIVTKNALVTRDVDVLAEMAKDNVISVSVSVTSLDQSLTCELEPRTSSPAARLRAIRTLSEAGIPVRVMAAPMIPGLNDHELPAILEAAADAGATTASYILLRLPLAVKPIFLEWLARTNPSRAERVISRIRSVRDGHLSNSTFGTRMRGTGEIADQIANTFHVFARKYGLDRPIPPLSTEHFQPPQPKSGQLRLFC